MQVQALDLQPASAKFDKAVRKEFQQFKAEVQKLRGHGYVLTILALILRIRIQCLQARCRYPDTLPVLVRTTELLVMGQMGLACRD